MASPTADLHRNSKGKVMIPFSSDPEMQKIPELTLEFLDHVLYDEEPLFISDEATIWDVSMGTAEELISRVFRCYKKPVSGRFGATLMETIANLTKAQIRSDLIS